MKLKSLETFLNEHYSSEGTMDIILKKMKSEGKTEETIYTYFKTLGVAEDRIGEVMAKYSHIQNPTAAHTDYRINGTHRNPQGFCGPSGKMTNLHEAFKEGQNIKAKVSDDKFDGDVYDITNDVDGTPVSKGESFRIKTIGKDEVILIELEQDNEYSIEPSDLKNFIKENLTEGLKIKDPKKVKVGEVGRDYSDHEWTVTKIGTGKDWSTMKSYDDSGAMADMFSDPKQYGYTKAELNKEYIVAVKHPKFGNAVFMYGGDGVAVYEKFDVKKLDHDEFNWEFTIKSDLGDKEFKAMKDAGLEFGTAHGETAVMGRTNDEKTKAMKVLKKIGINESEIIEEAVKRGGNYTMKYEYKADDNKQNGVVTIDKGEGVKVIAIEGKDVIFTSDEFPNDEYITTLSSFKKAINEGDDLGDDLDDLEDDLDKTDKESSDDKSDDKKDDEKSDDNEDTDTEDKEVALKGAVDDLQKLQKIKDILKEMRSNEDIKK